jgi:hypothetical protein
VIGSDRIRCRFRHVRLRNEPVRRAALAKQAIRQRIIAWSGWLDLDVDPSLAGRDRGRFSRTAEILGHDVIRVTVKTQVALVEPQHA